jgi:hypothetical protein
MVVLNVATAGEHDGPAAAVTTFTRDDLHRLHREIQEAGAMKADDPDLQAVLRWDRGTTWLEYTDLVEELAEATGFDRDSHAWGVVPPHLADRVTAALTADGGHAFRSEADHRRTDHEDVCWVGQAKHGCFEFITASLTLANLAQLRDQLEEAR